MNDMPLLPFPGDMEITKIPMPDEYLRLECLKIAAGSKYSSVISTIGDAAKLESHVRYGRVKDEKGYTTLGPECFIGPEGKIIAFQGDNFYRPCPNWVSKNDNGSSYCVEPVGHKSPICEDYEGRTYNPNGD